MRKKETEEKEKFNLEEACILWKNTSKGGVDYLRGYDLNKNRVIGFINSDSNEKLPKVKVYSTKADGNMDKELITLWEVKSKQGNVYLSGYTDDKENVIGFYGSLKNENTPFIKIYFKEK